MSFQALLTRCLLKHSKIWNKPIFELRDYMESIKSKRPITGVEIEKCTLGGLEAEEFIPKKHTLEKVIIYYHGGGFCLGIYAPNREFIARLAKASGRRIFVPDYRLAPEFPYPSALEDAVKAYTALLDQGHEPENIIMVGDSSGCGLILSSVHSLKKNGLDLPSALVHITPVVDFTGSGDTIKTKSKTDPFGIDDPFRLAKHYFGQADPSISEISPLFGSLESFPPMLIHGAELDVFMSDAQRLYEKAKASEVNVSLKVWKKMWHIFHMQDGFIPESKKAVSEIIEFIEQY